MIRHRCPACHHMMDSSPHLVGLTVPCHVCREPLVVPDKSSGESGSFVLAHAQAEARASKATLPLRAGVDDPRVEGTEDALSDLMPQSPKAWLIAGLLIGAVVLTAVSATLWWLAGR